MVFLASVVNQQPTFSLVTRINHPNQWGNFFFFFVCWFSGIGIQKSQAVDLASCGAMVVGVMMVSIPRGFQRHGVGGLDVGVNGEVSEKSRELPGVDHGPPPGEGRTESEPLSRLPQTAALPGFTWLILTRTFSLGPRGPRLQGHGTPL